ncbi:FAD-dependent oxidoreductase [Thermoanaerobacterium sp. DL9XJH110]|uniref:oxidoreductase n=1 Tax=Thermoanaerobacterium sp. DL9XJH110 TaxID=3386643 RepID=UPI003BB7B9CE
MLKALFTPQKINNCVIPNRLVVTAMVTNFCNEDGTLTDRFIKYHEEKAKGGWGLIITEDYAVNPNAKGYQFIAGLYNDEQIEGNKRLTDTIHKYESKIFCQIYHPGRQTSHFVNGGVQPVAPSAIPCPWCRDLPRELTVDEIHEIVGQFGDTALRAKKAGFDGVEVHAAHGYLLAEFLSPYANKRTDEYGGCFENRIRILKEVIADIRSKVGQDFPVIVRISGEERVEGGRTMAETLVLAREIESMGFDGIHVSSGVYGNYNKGIVSTMYQEHAWTTDFAAEVKKVVSIPVITVNRINEPKMADTIISMGKADFVGMGRGSLADPYLPMKAKMGDFESIRYCIGCLQGCVMQLLKGRSITCLVNPEIGHEYETDYTKVEQPKNVMVIGAGPGGLEAAMIAAKRGHRVTVYEQRNDIGGQFKSAAYPPCKGELSTFVSWIRHELKKLNVEIKLNTTVTEELIKEVNPDAIVLATGGVPVKPNIKGIDKDHVVFAEDVLLGKVPTKDLIVVCGGGEVGGETAAALALEEKKVSIVEMLPEILKELDPVQTIELTNILNKYGVKQYTNTKVVEITDNGVVCESKGNRFTLPADTIVLAFGYKPNKTLEDKARAYCREVYTIGGAVKTSNALDAIQDGFQVGLKL